MDIVPLGPGFAAELRGVTLADVAARTAAYDQVRAAFEEHSVLIFRGQEVTDETQLAFTSYWAATHESRSSKKVSSSSTLACESLTVNGQL